jgi:hypothetical protein
MGQNDSHDISYLGNVPSKEEKQRGRDSGWSRPVNAESADFNEPEDDLFLEGNQPLVPIELYLDVEPDVE